MNARFKFDDYDLSKEHVRNEKQKHHASKKRHQEKARIRNCARKARLSKGSYLK